MTVYTKVQGGRFYIHVPPFARDWASAVQGATGKDRMRRERGECGFEKLPGTTQKTTQKPIFPSALQGLGRSGWLGATRGWR